MLKIGRAILIIEIEHAVLLILSCGGCSLLLTKKINTYLFHTHRALFS